MLRCVSPFRHPIGKIESDPKGLEQFEINASFSTDLDGSRIRPQLSGHSSENKNESDRGQVAFPSSLSLACTTD